MLRIVGVWSVLVAIALACLGCTSRSDGPPVQPDASNPRLSSAEYRDSATHDEAAVGVAAEIEDDAQPIAEAAAAAEVQARAQATASAVAAEQQREASAAATAEARQASAAQPAGGRQSSPEAQTNGRPEVSLAGDPRYSTEVQSGTSSPIAVTLRNSGSAAAKEIKFQISRSFLRGFTFRNTAPMWTANDTFDENLVLNLPGISSGADRDYQVNFMAGATGEYAFDLAIIADGDVVGQYSGRAVILP